MSLSRGSFLRALIGAPFAAKAVERLIANGGPTPVAKPAKPGFSWGGQVPALEAGALVSIHTVARAQDGSWMEVRCR